MADKFELVTATDSLTWHVLVAPLSRAEALARAGAHDGVVTVVLRLPLAEVARLGGADGWDDLADRRVTADGFLRGVSAEAVGVTAGPPHDVLVRVSGEYTVDEDEFDDMGEAALLARLAAADPAPAAALVARFRKFVGGRGLTAEWVEFLRDAARAEAPVTARPAAP